MGYTTSTVHGIEVPDSAEANNVPEDIGKVVTALEAGSIVKRLTGAAISALTAPQKPAGLVVYNTTTGTMQISNGSTFASIPAGTPTNVLARRTFNQSITSLATATVTYDVEDADASGLLGSGIVTFATAGLYQVHFSAHVTGSGMACRAYLVHGSTNIALADANAEIYTVNMSTVVSVAASDTLKVTVQNYIASTIDVSTARLAVVRIGA